MSVQGVMGGIAVDRVDHALAGRVADDLECALVTPSRHQKGAVGERRWRAECGIGGP